MALSCLETEADRWVLVRDIASRVDVPRPYLAKILHALARAGIVRAKRGYRGGFMLARPAREISIGDIVTAMDGSGWLGGCMLGFSECTDDRACPAHALCKTEREKIGAFLRKLTLEGVAAFERRHGSLPVLATVSEQRPSERVSAERVPGRRRLKSGASKPKRRKYRPK